jgi:hypothetical protein
MIAFETREDPAVTSRRDLIAAAILTMTMATALRGRALASQDNVKPPTAANLGGLHDFDFLNGDWTTCHRKLKPGSDKDWVQFDGAFTQRIADERLGQFRGQPVPDAGRSVSRRQPAGLRSQERAVGGLVAGRPRSRRGRGQAQQGPVRERRRPVLFRWDAERKAGSLEGHLDPSDPGHGPLGTGRLGDGGKTWAVNWTTDFTRAKPGEPTVTDAWAPAVDRRDGVNAFDARPGAWKVRHRRLKERLAGSTEWVDFGGDQTWWPTLAGAGNVDDNVFAMPNGSYNGVTLRAYDPKTDQWSIWWLDGRNPHGDLEPPMKGRFVDGVASFHADDTLRGKPIKVRFIWSNITPTTAHWEQAFSPDGGKTWETNWFSDFSKPPEAPMTDLADRRAVTPGAGGPADPGGRADASAQARRSAARSTTSTSSSGSWTVHHRRLKKRLAGNDDWEEFEGSTTCQSLLGGVVNLNESFARRASGSVQRPGLRAFDARTGDLGRLVPERQRSAEPRRAGPRPVRERRRDLPVGRALRGAAGQGARAVLARCRRTRRNGSRPSRPTAARPGRPTGSCATAGPPDGMEIRHATLDDLPRLAPLFDRYRQFYGQPSDEGGARRFLAERMVRGQSVILLAFEDGQSRSASFSSIPASRRSGRADLRPQRPLCRAGPATQRGGRGGWWLAAAAMAREAGAAGLSLVTGVDNLPARYPV